VHAVSSPAGTETTAWSLLQDRVIGPLGIASFISAFGSAMVGLAFVYLTYARTGSVFRTVLVTAAYTLPAAIFSVAAGRLAQHHSRRRILLVTYTLKGCFYTIAAVLEITIGLGANALIVFSLINGVIAALSYPAWAAFERDVVPADKLDAANAFFSSLSSAAQLLGAVGGGFLLGLIGPGLVFLLNAVSYLPELVVLSRFHPKEHVTTTSTPHQHDLRRAVAAIRADPSLRRGFRSLIAVSLLAAPLFQLLPAVAAEIDSGAHTLGILTAMVALGGTAVTWAMVRLRRRYERRLIVALGLLLTGVTLVGFGISNIFFDGDALYPPVIAGLVVVGLTIGLGDSALAALVQSGAPEELEGSIFAVYAIVYTAIGPLGALVLAQAAGHLDVYALLAICGVILVIFGLTDRHPPDERHMAAARGPLIGGLILHGILHRGMAFRARSRSASPDVEPR
jgi:MFS family permease